MKLSAKELFSDISAQNTAWRELAQKCQDYYDHLQITEERKKDLEACERLDLVENLIQPTVNVALGHEERHRVSWKVMENDDDSAEVALALDQELYDVMELAMANRVCSDVYKDQIIKGFGSVWVERNPDPFGKTPYLVTQSELSETFWDMRSRRPDWSDCRWIARRKFMDVDEASALLPGEKKLIKAVMGEWSDSFQIGEEEAAQEWHNTRYKEWQSIASVGRSLEQVFDNSSRRKRVAVYEVYYRVPKTVEALVIHNNGLKEELDKKNFKQLLAIATGMAQVETPDNAVTTQIRKKIFLGPHEVSDEPSPHPHNYFPAVPFFAYVEGGQNVPYGIVRGMLDPQDAYNEVGFNLLHIIEHKRIFMEEDAISEQYPLKASDLVEEINRKDGFVVLKKNGGLQKIKIEQDWPQFQALLGQQDRYEQRIQTNSGFSPAYAGNVGRNQSGVAIDAAVDLGAVSMAEVNGNHGLGRKLLGELMLAHVVHDMGDKPRTVSLRKKGVGSSTGKSITLNAQNNEGRASNVVAMARYQVAMGDVATSPGYQQRTHQQLGNILPVVAADPRMGPIVLEQWLETSSLPGRHEALERYRKVTGYTDDPDKQAEMEQQAAAAQQQAQALEKSKTETELAEKQASAEMKSAQAGKYQADAAQTIVEIEIMKKRAAIEEEKARRVALMDQRRGDAAQLLEAV